MVEWWSGGVVEWWSSGGWLAGTHAHMVEDEVDGGMQEEAYALKEGHHQAKTRTLTVVCQRVEDEARCGKGRG